MPAVHTQPRPEGLVVMRQRWEDLLFLHWGWDPAEVQKTLPDGLDVDCWNGQAYIGLVPFFMCRVRPSGLPAVPLLSDFLELNVRTYVRDRHGRAGVWFYSLDCNQPIAVIVAQKFFHLPYFHAKMKAPRDDGRIDYFSKRAGATDDCRIVYEPSGPPEAAEQGSFEEFLVERYRLFSQRGKTLLTGCVWHEPYRISAVRFDGTLDAPMKAAGFDPDKRPPVHAAFSRGVDVRVYPVSKVTHRTSNGR